MASRWRNVGLGYCTFIFLIETRKYSLEWHGQRYAHIWSLDISYHAILHLLNEQATKHINRLHFSPRERDSFFFLFSVVRDEEGGS
jgi:hypothetical protein